MHRELDLYRSRLRFFRKHYGAFSAAMLKLQMLAFTLVKLVVYSAKRAMTQGRFQRRTVPLHDILAA
jgi:hypothetical protein